MRRSIPLFPLLPALLLALAPATALAAKPGAAMADGSRYVARSLLAAADDAPEQMTWDAATLWCGRATLHGRTDWRLPTAEELALLYRHRRAIGGFADSADDENDPLAYLKILQDSGQSHGYWSSSRDGRAASGLDFDSGNAFRLDVADTPVLFSKSVRCVRDGN